MRRPLFIISVFLICLMQSAYALEVSHLKTMAYRNPIGIDVVEPTFSWVLTSDQRGVVQETYSIRIATDRNFQDIVWQSGTISSQESVDVPAKGFSTSPRTRYYWQVSVTDNKGNTATSAENAYFETGLGSEAGWGEAKWIKTGSGAADQNEDGTPITDYEVEVSFEIKSFAAGLIFAASDHNNYYMWQINTITGSPRFRPHKWTNGSAACLSENALAVKVQNNEEHVLRIEVRDAKTATTYIDGTKVDTRTGDFKFGDFGFREDYDQGNVPEQAYFDNFVVTSGGKTLYKEDFEEADLKMFAGGSVENGRMLVKGPGTYCWQQKVSDRVHYDVEADMTLINDNASICFSATGSDTYLMWAINTFGLSKPVVRRHAYLSGALTYDDTTLPMTNKDVLGKPHHIKISCETPYVRTYIDGTLVDTYTDTKGILSLGDVGFRVSSTGNEREKAYFDNLKVTVYDSEGGSKTLLSEDFENNTTIFDEADVKLYNGSKQLYMESAQGTSKRVMQSEGSVMPGAPIMRKEFTTKGQVVKARLYATGLGVYNVYINGQRVGVTHDDGTTEQDELKPGFTEFHKTVFYTTHDVTALVQNGENAIGAELTSGWWSGGIAHGMYGSKPLAFKGKLILTYADGTEESINSDTSWRSSTSGPLRSGDIYNGETYDARLESQWSSPGYDDSEWQGTAISTDFNGTIRAFEGPIVKAVPALARHPKTITIYEGSTNDNGSLGSVNVISETSGTSSLSLKAGQTAVIDLAQNAAGWISFKAKGNRGTRIRVRFGEMLNTSGNSSRGDDGPKGSIYTANLRSAAATVKYTLKGDPDGESYHPTTSFFGFRYMEIVATDDVTLTDVVGETVTSAMDEFSTFQTSHPDVNQLYSNVMWGQRSNFLSVPTDCPQRDERQGWTADTQVFSMAGLYNADTRTFYEKWMRDMRDAQRTDGAFPHIAPYAWGVGFGAAAWADAGVILPWKVYLMTGDKKIIEDNWAAMEKYMDFLATQSDGTYKYNGGGTNYGDWVSYVATDSRYCSVCYYAYDAQLMAKMAKVLSSKTGDIYYAKSLKYEKLFENIKTEWQQRYTSASTGLPTINTQCAYLMALKYNLLKNETARKRTIQALRSAIVNNGYKLNTGFLGTAILNQTLTEVGLNNEAYTLLLQRNDPSWLYSIDQGATTIWERWNSYTVANGYGPVSMNSFNHYAYGIVAEWMYRYMAGIVPDEANAGFRHFILAPNPDRRPTLLYSQKRITSVDAQHWSPVGAIKAAWQCDGGDEMKYVVTIPANTTATLYIPVAEGLSLMESGKDVTEGVEGVQYQGVEDGKAVCLLGSGTYSFTVGVGTKITSANEAELKGAGKVYNLSGMYVGEELKSQPRGIYLQDGKKTAK